MYLVESYKDKNFYNRFGIVIENNLFDRIRLIMKMSIIDIICFIIIYGIRGVLNGKLYWSIVEGRRYCFL